MEVSWFRLYIASSKSQWETIARWNGRYSCVGNAGCLRKPFVENVAPIIFVQHQNLCESVSPAVISRFITRGTTVSGLWVATRADLTSSDIMSFFASFGRSTYSTSRRNIGICSAGWRYVTDLTHAVPTAHQLWSARRYENPIHHFQHR